MEINRDDMVDTGNRKKIGEHTSSDSASMALLLRLS